ncbi:MAG TPA: hypothetical protein VI138_05890, partial [Candidatus Dormibacteraeota bacterium]
MSQAGMGRRALPPGLDLNLDRLESKGRLLLERTTTRIWWYAAGLCLVLGGAAAGLQAPVAGAWFWHLATGELIAAHGFAGSATYLAHSGRSLDLRSWLSDLGTYLLYRGWGLGGLAVLGALGGAATGLVILLGAWRRRAHPLILLLAGGLGLLALAPLLTDFAAETLALLAGLLLVVLELLPSRGRWGALGMVVLVALWANTQSDAALAVLVFWGWVVFARWDASQGRRANAPSWWLLPLTAAALLLSPRGIGAVTALPLSLGALGEHPLLAAWSSIDFHPWSARVAELAGLVLIVAYWLARGRLRRADAYLGLVTATLALIWSNYLPWFLVVAAGHSAWYLTEALSAGRARGDRRSRPGPGDGRSLGLTAAVPSLLVIALLA